MAKTLAETGGAKPRIGIVISTTREKRFGPVPAQWIYDIARRRDELDFEIIDLRDYPLPHYGEAGAAGEDATSQVIARWRAKIASLDGYIFVTAEYNHSIPGVLKNALDHAYDEYRRKPAAFVGYGGVGDARAVEQLRLICIELQMAPLRHAVHIATEPLLGVKQQGKRLEDYDYLAKSAETMLDELTWWTYTLRAGRSKAATAD